MRLNEFTKIAGNKVILVPYEAKHVEKYHQWMQNPDLQELTASEPLSLEEEYDMQRSWREDEDKCTFLVLCRKNFDLTGDEIESLVGDTNLFIHYDDERKLKIAEAEIMIAEPSSRGKGLGKEAMLLMFKYALTHLQIDLFEVKIGMDNKKSLNMFQSMQFTEVARAEVFREVTLERLVTEEWIAWLNGQISFCCELYEKLSDT